MIPEGNLLLSLSLLLALLLSLSLLLTLLSSLSLLVSLLLLLLLLLVLSMLLLVVYWRPRLLFFFCYVRPVRLLRAWISEGLTQAGSLSGVGILMPVKFYRGSPGKFDSRTLNRKTLIRWTGRRPLLVCASEMFIICLFVYISVYLSVVYILISLRHYHLLELDVAFSSVYIYIYM